MSTQRKLIHGTTSQRMASTPVLGQVGSDDTLGQVVVGDGVTPGGILMAREDRKNIGSLGYIQELKTADYTVSYSDSGKILIFNSATPVTLSLAASSELGPQFSIMVKNAGAGAVTVDPNGSETINGVSTYLISQGYSLVISCDGSNLRTLLETGISASSASASPPCGRLTLTSGSPIQTTNALAATTIYYTPYMGTTVPIWDGSKFADRSFSELSMALDSNSGDAGYHASGAVMDLILFDDVGVIRLGTGPAWSGPNIIGTGAGSAQRSKVGSTLVNAVSALVRFGSAAGNTKTVSAGFGTIVGSVMFSANGQTEFTIAPAAAAGGTNNKLLLSNVYNLVDFVALEQDSTVNSTLSTISIRMALNGANNKINFLQSTSDQVVQCDYTTNVNILAAGAVPYIGIGLDSTTVISSNRSLLASSSSALLGTSVNSKYSGFPGIGFHTLYALEGNLTAIQMGNNGSTYHRFAASIML